MQVIDQQKVTKKVTWAIYEPDERKLKKVLESWNWTSINVSTKSPQIYAYPQFLSMSEKNCGIYWLDSYNLLTNNNSLRNSKQMKIIFLFMLVHFNLNNACVSWHF